jgi:hypothetical protein
MLFGHSKELVLNNAINMAQAEYDSGYPTHNLVTFHWSDSAQTVCSGQRKERLPMS